MTQSSLFDAVTIPAAVPTGAAPAVRYFHRCADCLSVVTLDREYRAATCGECGGAVEFMGRTERNRLVKDAMLCPCDARCTGARGPSCDCRCGGENHGSNLWVPVTVDAGGVPLVHTYPGAAKWARHYRELLEAARAALSARYGAIIERKRAGVYLDAGEFRLYCRSVDLHRAISAAAAMRSHHGRNRKLEAIIKAAA